MEKKTKMLVIPNDVILKATVDEIGIYSLLMFYDKGKNDIVVTQEELAEKTGKSTRTIRRYLKSLESKNLIRKSAVCVDGTRYVLLDGNGTPLEKTFDYVKTPLPVIGNE